MGNIINDENVIGDGKNEFIDRVKNAVNIDELKKAYSFDCLQDLLI